MKLPKEMIPKYKPNKIHTGYTCSKLQIAGEGRRETGTSDTLHSWVERVNMVKMPVFHILICKFTVLIKILVLLLFVDTAKCTLKCILKGTDLRTAKTSFEKGE